MVVGHEADAVHASLTDRGIRVQPDSTAGIVRQLDSAPPDRAIRLVINPAYTSGQLSSLLAGLNAIDGPHVRAMLMTLVDVPAASPATIRRVIDRYLETNAAVVRPIRGVVGERRALAELDGCAWEIPDVMGAHSRRA